MIPFRVISMLVLIGVFLNSFTVIQGNWPSAWPGFRDEKIAPRHRDDQLAWIPRDEDENGLYGVHFYRDKKGKTRAQLERRAKSQRDKNGCSCESNEKK